VSDEGLYEMQSSGLGQSDVEDVVVVVVLPVVGRPEFGGVVVPVAG